MEAAWSVGIAAAEDGRAPKAIKNPAFRGFACTGGENRVVISP